MYIARPEALNSLGFYNKTNIMKNIDIKKLVKQMDFDFRFDKNSYYEFSKSYGISYDKLPRCVRYFISENQYDSVKIYKVYEYGTDINIIYKEYCEFFLNYNILDKKIIKLYNELKGLIPEEFL